MTKQEQMLAALMAAQAGNARFGSVDFAGTPVLEALGGERADIQRRNQALFEPPTGSATKEQAFSRIARALLGRYQKNQEAADTTDLYSKLATPEITEEDYEAYSSPYKAEAREAKKRAELAPPNQGLGIDAQDLYTPASLDMPVPDSRATIDPNTGATTYSMPQYSNAPLEEFPISEANQISEMNQNAFEPASGALGLDPAQLGTFQSQAGTADQYIDMPLGEDPRMMSALIGDPQTVEQERGQIAGDFALDQSAPGALLDRIGGVETRTDAGRNLQQQMMANTSAREAAEARAKAIRGEEFGQALLVAQAGRAPAGITKGISPSSKYESGYAHINLRTGEDLGEAPAPSTHYNPQEKQEEEFYTGRGDTYTEAYEQREEADKMLGAISQMTYLAGQTDTGALAEWKLGAKKLAVAFGFDYDATEIATAEAMRSKGMDFVLMLIGQTKGAISNQEMAAFKAASAGLENTALGNKMILDLSRKVAERMRAESDAVRALYGSDQKVGRYQLDKAKFAARDAFGPLYTDPRAEPPKRFVIDGKPGTKAEFYALSKEDQDFMRRGGL